MTMTKAYQNVDIKGTFIIKVNWEGSGKRY